MPVVFPKTDAADVTTSIIRGVYHANMTPSRMAEVLGGTLSTARTSGGRTIDVVSVEWNSINITFIPEDGKFTVTRCTCTDDYLSAIDAITGRARELHDAVLAVGDADLAYINIVLERKHKFSAKKTRNMRVDKSGRFLYPFTHNDALVTVSLDTRERLIKIG